MLRFAAIVLITMLSSLSILAGVESAINGDEATTSESAPAEAVDTESDSIASPKKKGFIAKVIDYFSNTNNEPTGKLNISIIGGPSYSSDTQLSVAVLAATVYQTDSLTMYSGSGIYVQGAITGFYQIGMRGTHIAPRNKWRVPYEVTFDSYPTYFWGIGYENNVNDDNKVKFKQITADITASLEWKLAQNLYFGPAVHLKFCRATDIHDWSRTLADGTELTARGLWQGENLKPNNVGVGFNFNYDTRDFLDNAYEGIYVGVQQRLFPGGVLNEKFFGSTEITINKYNRVWNGGVLACQFHTMLTYGDTPWSMLAFFGGSRSMRGYYKARFRDKCEADATIELRQYVWKRCGFALWGAVGNVFPNLKSFDIQHTLPNYGVGFRWEFKKRTNVRIDLGFGRHTNGIEFSVAEVF